MYNVLDVCRHVINYSNDHGHCISNLKLQKILYFIQAYFLISKSERCFAEKIVAWEFGPVVPEAYREYKQFGGASIPKVSHVIHFDQDNIWDSKVQNYIDNVISEEDKKLINEVVDKFADYSATDLVNLTHNQGPWIDAYTPRMNNEITPHAIKEYFND